MMYPYSYEAMSGALNQISTRCLCTFYSSCCEYTTARKGAPPIYPLKMADKCDISTPKSLVSGKCKQTLNIPRGMNSEN